MAAVFCAVGHHGLRAVSNDGYQWPEPLLHDEESLHIKTLIFGGGMFFALGQTGPKGIYFRSKNGVDWETHDFNAGYTFKGAFTWFKGRFIHAGGSGTTRDDKPFVRFSEDGFQWTKQKRISGTNMLRRFAQGRGRLVGVGEYGRRSWTEDGENWHDIEDVQAKNTLIDVAFGNGMFVGGGLHGMRMFSEDGESWSEPIPGKEGEHINTIEWDGERFVGVGQGATYFSPDGRGWERVPNRNAAIVSTFGNGTWVGSIWRGKIQTSKDAIEWETTADFRHHVEAVAWGKV